jgi:hypothetical protein
MLLNREKITNAVVMIQPSLISYSLSSPPTPVMLDVSSIVADRILLLDAYFSVIIFHGTNVAQWRKEGYQNLSEHKVGAFVLKDGCMLAEISFEHIHTSFSVSDTWDYFLRTLHMENNVRTCMHIGSSFLLGDFRESAHMRSLFVPLSV